MNLPEIENKEEWWFVLGSTACYYFSHNERHVMKNKEYFDLCLENRITPFDALNKFDHYLNNKK